MIYGLCLASLAALAMGLAVLLKRKTDVTIALGMTAIIGVLYIAGLWGNLRPGLYAVLVLSLLSLAYAVRSLPKQEAGLWHTSLLTPGFVVFMLLAALLPVVSQKEIVTWDEFSHWGLVTKNMYALDALGNAPVSTVAFRNYPPGISLLQYFFVGFSPGFQEQGLFQAKSLLMVGLLLPCMETVSWKEWKKAPFFGALLLLPFVFDTSAYSEIYVDTVLGLMLANLLFHSFAWTAQARGSVILLAGTSFLLALTKESGLALVMLALMVMAADLLWGSEGAAKRDAGIRMGAVFGGAALATVSWRAYLALSGYAPAAGGGSVAASLGQLLSGTAPAYLMDVIKAFIFRTLAYDTTIAYTVGAVFVSMGLLAAGIAFHPGFVGEKESGRLRKAMALLFAGYLLYAAFLLGMYLFHFSRAEAMRLASYRRYMATYALGAFAFLGMLWYRHCALKQDLRRLAALLVVVALFVPNIVSIAFSYTADRGVLGERRQAARAVYAPAEGLSGRLEPGVHKVFLVSQGDAGYDYWVLRYLVAPVRTQEAQEPWSIAPEPSSGGEGAQGMSAAAWAALLREGRYTHVYLFRLDDAFGQDYGALFATGSPPQAETLYQIQFGEELSLVKEQGAEP